MRTQEYHYHSSTGVTEEKKIHKNKLIFAVAVFSQQRALLQQLTAYVIYCPELQCFILNRPLFYSQDLKLLVVR